MGEIIVRSTVTTPPRASPRASRPAGRPGVGHTPGITAAAAAPGAVIKVMPRVGPTPPRARATLLLTKAFHLYYYVRITTSVVYMRSAAADGCPIVL